MEGSSDIDAATGGRAGSRGGSNPSEWVVVPSKKKRQKKWLEWEGEIRRERAEDAARSIRRRNASAKQLSELELARDIERVRSARVIGCTTTGGALHHALLEEAGCGVVIVEEAAEVLEAHVLASLGTSTKHVIMIGKRQYAFCSLLCCRKPLL